MMKNWNCDTLINVRDEIKSMNDIENYFSYLDLESGHPLGISFLARLKLKKRMIRLQLREKEGR